LATYQDIRILPTPAVGSLLTSRSLTMTESRRALEPVDRISEVLFGLIIVLTFTCSLGFGRVE
jgi:hypothetical protein